MASETETTTETVGENSTLFDSESTTLEQELENRFDVQPQETEEVTEETESTDDEESTEEIQEEADEEDDSDDEESTEEADETPKGVQKRINKAVKKQKEAEERAQALEDRIQKLESGEVKPSKPQSALEEVKVASTQEALDQLDDDSQQIIDYALDNPEGVLNEDGSEKYTAEQLKAMRDTARATQKSIRSRRKVIDDSDKQTQEVEQMYPSLADRDSAASKAVDNVLEMIPSLRELPNYKYVALALIKGDQAIQSEGTTATKPAKTAKKKKAAPIEVAPSLGNQSEQPALKKASKDRSSKKFAERLQEVGEDAVDEELLSRFG